MEFDNILTRLYTNGSVSIEECLYFIETTANVYNPKVSYNEQDTLTVFQMGMGKLILTTCMQVVASNPDLFKIQVITITSKHGEILKTYINKL